MIDATIEIALTVFMMLMLIAQLIALRFRIPYTLVLVFIGIIVSAASALLLSSNPFSSVLLASIQTIRSVYNQLVGSGLFVGLIVPPLIFEAMMHVKRRDLRAVIRPSLALATVGVLLSVAVTSFVVWRFAGLSLFSAMIFAVIISPTDTITVLQIFKRIRVPSRLSTLMDMEAGFNDATAIVLFSILISSVGLEQGFIVNGVETFLYSFVGGSAIGIVIGAAARWIHVRIDDKLAEVTLTISAVYGTYVLATALGTSGLIAVAVVGLYFGSNTMKMLTARVRVSIVSFWEIAAFVGNAVAFLFIGFVANLSLFLGAAGLILVAYLSTVIARSATVYPMFAIFSDLREKLRFEWGNTAVIGGVRGALSIALVVTLASSGAVSGAELSTITTMVLGVVFVSIILQVPLLSAYTARKFGSHRTTHELQ